MTGRDDDRLVRGLSVIVVTTLLVGIGVAVVRSSKRTTRVLGVRQTQSPSPTPDATVPSPLPSIIVSPTTSSPTPVPSPTASPSPAPTTAPVKQCRNSTDPACGRFYWKPSPGADAPLEAELRYSNESPETGEVVSFVLTVTDADARPSGAWAAFGDGNGQTPPACNVKRYGAWTPPAKSGGSARFTFEHAYQKAGRYSVVFTVRSGECGNPYGSELRLAVPITVHAGPATSSPSPSPSPTPSPSSSPFPI